LSLKAEFLFELEIAHVIGPLVKIWSAIDGARKGQEKNDNFSVMDMLKLVEQVNIEVEQI
jgi:hypothetical protein